MTSKLFLDNLVITPYLTIKCLISVCLCVCVSVCVSGYTFPQFSTIFSKFGGKPSTGHYTFRGYIVCVCTQRARVRVQCACINRVRIHLYMDGFSSNLQ
jgi:hypothetical protein